MWARQLILARDGAVPSMLAQTGMLQIQGSTLTLSLGVPPTWRLVTWNTWPSPCLTAWPRLRRSWETWVTLEESNADARNVEDCWTSRTSGFADLDLSTPQMDWTQEMKLNQEAGLIFDHWGTPKFATHLFQDTVSTSSVTFLYYLLFTFYSVYVIVMSSPLCAKFIWVCMDYFVSWCLSYCQSAWGSLSIKRNIAHQDMSKISGGTNFDIFPLISHLKNYRFLEYLV